MLYAGQTPAWISPTRKEAGLKGDKIMPRTKSDMIKRLEKTNKPLLQILKNTKYNQMQAPLKYDYPVLSGAAPKFTVCTGNGGGGNGGNGGGGNGGNEGSGGEENGGGGEGGDFPDHPDFPWG